MLSASAKQSYDAYSSIDCKPLTFCIRLVIICPHWLQYAAVEMVTHVTALLSLAWFITLTTSKILELFATNCWAAYDPQPRMKRIRWVEKLVSKTGSTVIGVSQVAGQQKQLPPDNFDFCVFLFSISHLSARNSSMLTSFVILVEEERLLLHLIQQLNLFVR